MSQHSMANKQSDAEIESDQICYRSIRLANDITSFRTHSLLILLQLPSSIEHG